MRQPRHHVPILRLKAASPQLLAGYPWVYRYQVKITPSLRALPAGQTVNVVTTSGKTLGSATLHLDKQSEVVAFIHSPKGNTAINRRLLQPRLAAALALRERAFNTPYYRLVNADGDNLPGLLIDRFNDILVVQLNSQGMAAHKKVVIDCLHMLLAPAAIVVTSMHGIAEVYGTLPEMPIPVAEHGLTFSTDLVEHDKAFWHYHHRATRAHMARLAKGLTVLDLFCQAGAVGISCLKNGATHATFVDMSIRSLELAHISARAAGVMDKCSVLEGDAFTIIKRLQADKNTYDLVALTPPRQGVLKKDKPRALKTYTDLAKSAATLTATNGYLVVSCNEPFIDTNAFIDALLKGVHRAKREAQLVRVAHGDIDFPVHLQLMHQQPLTSVTLRLDMRHE